MTILASIMLVVAIVTAGTLIAYYLQKDQPSMESLLEEESQEEQSIVEQEATKTIEILNKTPHLDNQEDTVPVKIPKKRKYYPKAPKPKA